MNIKLYSENIVKALMILSFYDSMYGFCFKTRDTFAAEWNEAAKEYEIVWDPTDDNQSILTYSRFIKHFGTFTEMKQILKDLKWLMQWKIIR